MSTNTTPGLSGQQPTMPMPASGPQQPQGGAPEGQSPQGGLQDPASPVMQLLANWMRVAGEVGQHYSMIADKMQKITSAVREALMILAREHSQGQQGRRLPSDTDQPQGQQEASYPPSGY